MSLQEQMRADVLGQQVALIEQQQSSYLVEWKEDTDKLDRRLREAQYNLKNAVSVLHCSVSTFCPLSEKVDCWL